MGVGEQESVEPVDAEAGLLDRRGGVAAGVTTTSQAGPAWPSRQTDWRGEYRDDPVFTWPDGTIISPDRYTEWFARHRKASGLRRIRLHDLRHTYATVGLRNATGWH